MNDFIKRVTTDRLSGDRPAPPRAIGAAAVVGTVGAIVTYKLLRK
jgi:hypothetical protein